MANPAPSPGRLGLRTARGKETVEFWKTQLAASWHQWQEGGEGRESIVRAISELQFPPLMFKDGGTSVPSTRRVDKAVRRMYPHVDQIDVNLPSRYVQKLASTLGDESPDVDWSRDWTAPWEDHAYLFNRLVMRWMSKAGAPENNADGARDVCSDGITTYWVNFTHNVTADDLFRATESVDQVIERVLEDPEGYQPAEGADHVLMAEVLESRSYDVTLQAKDPTGLVAQALRIASDKHYDAAAKDDRTNWNWRRERLTLEHERLPYGTHARMEPRTTSFRHARWVARLIRMPVRDARVHPMFHPSIRKQLVNDSHDVGERGNRLGSQEGTFAVDQVKDEYLGLCSIWEIHDKKHKELIYLSPQLDRFLNAGTVRGVSRMRHPFLDEDGRPLIPAIGPYPGFFPCFFCVPSPPKRDDEKKKLGQPLLAPGMKFVWAITKFVSHYLQTVKRASSAVYEAHPKLGDPARRAIKAGIDGTIFTRPADVPPGESIVPVQWKAPSEELFRQVNELIMQWCMVQSFPIAELTTRPVADTATQEKIGVMAGDAWMNEVVRKFEVSYAVQCHIVMHLAMYFTDRAEWAELIGMQDATRLHKLVKEIRFPPELPNIRFAPRRRGAEPVRIRQLLDLDERLATDVDPLFQLPRWDRDRILQEVARGLELGKLSRYIPDKEHMKLLAEAKARVMAEQEFGDAAAPAESGAPPGRDGPEVDRPAVAGSPGGSASNGRTPQSARRSRRGGRRGRAQGAATMGAELSAAEDSGAQP